MLSPSESQQQQPKKKVTKIKQTLQLLHKSKAIKKPEKQAIKPVVKKPLKIKSPKKPSILFCDVTYQRLQSDQAVTKFNGNRMCLSIFAANVSVSDETCVLCHNQNGLKTQTDQGQIHPICGLLCDKVTVDFQTLKMTLAEAPEEKPSAKCDLCDKPGWMLKCLQKQCKRYVHPFCVYEFQRKLALQKASEAEDEKMRSADESSSEEEDSPDGWLIECFIQDYTKQKYCGNQDLLKSPLAGHFQGILQLLTPENSATKQQELQSHQDEVPSRWNLPERGGKVNLLCGDHRTTETHCHCGQNPQHSHMVMCDHCERWQHTKCEKIKSSDAQTVQEYKCTTCQEFDAKHTEVIKTVLDGTSQTALFQTSTPNFIEWDSWQRSILPTKLQPPYRFLTIITLAQAWQIQTTQLEKCPCSLELLKQQVIVAQHLPVKLCVDKLLDRISKCLAFQQKNKLPELALKEPLSSEDNKKIVQQAKDALAKQFKAIQVVTEEAALLQHTVVGQYENTMKASQVLDGSLKVTLDQLFEIIELVDDQAISAQLGKLSQQTKKWLTCAQKFDRVVQVAQHIESAPTQIDLSAEISELKRSIEECEKWDKLYVETEDVSKKLELLTQDFQVKSDLQIKAHKEIPVNEVLKYFDLADRKKRCFQSLNALLAKLPGDHFVTTELTRQRDIILETEKLITAVVNGEESISKARIEEVQSKIDQTPVMVPGEIQFDKVKQLYEFSQSKTLQIPLELLQIPYKVEIPNRSDIDSLIKEHDRLTESFSQSDSVQKVLEAIDGIEKVSKKLLKHRIKTDHDMANLKKFLSNLGDLTFPTKESAKAVSLPLVPLLRQYPDLQVLKSVQKQISNAKQVQEYSATLNHKVSLKKLQEMGAKLDGQPEFKAKIDEKVAKITKWQADLKTFQMTDSQLRKKLAQNQYEQLIEQAESLQVKANEIEFEPTQDESKYLSKVKHWSSIVQTSFGSAELTQEQLDKLHSNLRNLKSLTHDIPRCKDVWDELQTRDEFYNSLKEVTTLETVKEVLKEYSVKFKLIKVDTSDVQEDIRLAEEFCERAKSDDPEKLLKDEIPELVPESFVSEVKQRLQDNFFAQKLPVADFVSKYEKMQKKFELSSDHLKTAKKVLKFGESKKQRLDEELIDNSVGVYFSLPKPKMSQLLECREKLRSIQASDRNTQDKITELQQLPIVSQYERDLLARQEEKVFATQLVKMISELKEGEKVNGEDLERVQDLKSEDAQKCAEFYKQQLSKFEELQKKPLVEYSEIFECHKSVMDLKVDFGSKEQKFKQQLWHKRLDKFISGLEDKDAVHADYLRFWYDEGQELGLTKDPKFKTLDDICEKLDHIYKAFRACTQAQLPDYLKYVETICPRVSFERQTQDLKTEGSECPIELLKKLIAKRKEHDTEEHLTGLQQSSDEEMTQCEQESQDLIPVVKTKKEKSAPQKKRNVKAEQKTSSSKIEELKRSLTKKKKVGAAVDEKPASGIKGLAGGVKIGGAGIKSKLASLKAPSKPVEKPKKETEPEPKESEEPEKAADEDVEMKPVEEPAESKPEEEPEKPKKKVISKPAAVAKQQKPAVVKAKPAPAAETAAKPAESKSLLAKKPIIKKAIVKPEPTSKKGTDEAETAEKTPAAPQKLQFKSNTLLQKKPTAMVGVKRSFGGGGGLAASLKKLG